MVTAAGAGPLTASHFIMVHENWSIRKVLEMPFSLEEASVTLRS